MEEAMTPDFEAFVRHQARETGLLLPVSGRI
jgi:hypothetical protein